jgi:NitT/TauT family transport system substrate-binding protein
MNKCKAFLAAAVLLSATATHAFAQPAKTVRINQAFQSLLYLPLYVARDKGFFEAAGVDVKITTGGGAAQSWSAVLGGSADFSIHDPVFIPISKAKGGPGVVVAAIQDAPAVWVVGKDPANLQNDVSRFKDKTVTTMPEPDSTWAFFSYLMQANKLGKDYAKINQVGVGKEMAPLLAGRSDYALGTEPQISQVETQGMNVVYSFSANPDWYPFAFSALLSTEDYVKNHAEETQAVVNALQRASEFIYSNTDEAVKVAQDAFPDLDKAVVEKAVKREMDAKAYPKEVVVSEKSWENAMRIADFVGIIDKDAETSSYASNVNTTFTKKAIEQAK